MVAESAYPERRIGFGPLLAPVPNKVVHEVQYHLDLRIVERFWGSDEKWERIKGERIARFSARITFQSLERADELLHYFLE